MGKEEGGRVLAVIEFSRKKKENRAKCRISPKSRKTGQNRKGRKHIHGQGGRGKSASCNRIFEKKRKLGQSAEYQPNLGKQDKIEKVNRGENHKGSFKRPMSTVKGWLRYKQVLHYD